ncbi:hypothetical protein EC968_009938 [Mortierella alpina]|nr:hypothetical protein EC968_009938 [Mortierella alpina]
MNYLIQLLPRNRTQTAPIPADEAGVAGPRPRRFRRIRFRMPQFLRRNRRAHTPADGAPPAGPAAPTDGASPAGPAAPTDGASPAGPAAPTDEAPPAPADGAPPAAHVFNTATPTLSPAPVPGPTSPSSTSPVRVRSPTRNPRPRGRHVNFKPSGSALGSLFGDEDQ